MTEHMYPPSNPALARQAAQQQAILDCIQEFTQAHGFPPSLAEIVECVGVAKSVVFRRLQELVKAGRLADPEGRRRAWRVTDPRDAAEGGAPGRTKQTTMATTSADGRA